MESIEFSQGKRCFTHRKTMSYDLKLIALSRALFCGITMEQLLHRDAAIFSSRGSKKRLNKKTAILLRRTAVRHTFTDCISPS